MRESQRDPWHSEGFLRKGPGILHLRAFFGDVQSTGVRQTEVPGLLETGPAKMNGSWKIKASIPTSLV